MSISFAKIFSRTALGAGILATNIVMLAGAASADGYRGHGREGFRGPAPRAYAVPERRHGDHDGLAKGVAIGLGALVLGSIIASEADRRARDRDRDGY